METDDSTPRPVKRFQYSLRTLMLFVIGLGLVGLLIKQALDISDLRKDNLMMRDELGYLNVGDPTKIWARGNNKTFPYHQHYQVYIPEDMHCLIGIRGKNIIDKDYDTNCSRFISYSAKKGQILKIDVELVNGLDGKLMAGVWFNGGASYVELSPPEDGRVWPGGSYSICGLSNNNTAREFETGRVFDLIRIRTQSNSNEPKEKKDGLWIYFVPHQSDKHPLGRNYP